MSDRPWVRTHEQAAADLAESEPPPAIKALFDAIIANPLSGCDPWEVVLVLSEAMEHPELVMSAVVEAAIQRDKEDGG